MISRLIPRVSDNGLHKLIMEHELDNAYIKHAGTIIWRDNPNVYDELMRASFIGGHFEKNIELGFCVYDMMNFTKPLPRVSLDTVQGLSELVESYNDFNKSMKHLIDTDRNLKIFIDGFCENNHCIQAKAPVTAMYGLFHLQKFNEFSISRMDFEFDGGQIRKLYLMMGEQMDKMYGQKLL